MESSLNRGADSASMPFGPLPFLFPAVCNAAMVAAVEKPSQNSEEKAKRFAEISTLNHFLKLKYS